MLLLLKWAVGCHIRIVDSSFVLNCIYTQLRCNLLPVLIVDRFVEPQNWNLRIWKNEKKKLASSLSCRINDIICWLEKAFTPTVSCNSVKSKNNTSSLHLVASKTMFHGPNCVLVDFLLLGLNERCEYLSVCCWCIWFSGTELIWKQFALSLI